MTTAAPEVGVPVRSTGRTGLLGAGAVLLLAAVAAVVLFRFAGGSWYIVETPSMGAAAPVGTLLVDRPARIADLAVGDIVTFRPPTSPGEVYSHRVVALTADGIRTRGDINGAPDGWVVPQQDLLGRAVAVLPAAGWVVRAVPIVVAGCLLTAVMTRRFTGARRAVSRALGASLSVALAAAWLHPFAGMVLLTTVADGQAVVATVVSTGVLPIEVSAAGSGPLRLAPGEVGHLRIEHILGGHRVDITSSLDLPWWGWLVLAAVCLAPLAVPVAVLARRRMRRRVPS